MWPGRCVFPRTCPTFQGPSVSPWTPCPSTTDASRGICVASTTGGAVIVDPEAPKKNCSYTLEHELAHVWQARSYGLLQPLTYALSPPLWEPEHPWGEVPASPRVLEWSLLRFWLPLGGP